MVEVKQDQIQSQGQERFWVRGDIELNLADQ